ncbi:hypothetical protein BQ8482_360013 [Mesorhizobium delmotii]|uniref:Uncharacterized protein n=1 Tax=Mesorhizobium delmotii TaxID=1631247 RepID=A0A2P9AR23_9HYPH|nr:hypothetical protein BQ8482_360013 [Mesorhizobium delmotii]
MAISSCAGMRDEESEQALVAAYGKDELEAGDASIPEPMTCQTRDASSKPLAGACLTSDVTPWTIDCETPSQKKKAGKMMCRSFPICGQREEVLAAIFRRCRSSGYFRSAKPIRRP